MAVAEPVVRERNVSSPERIASDLVTVDEFYALVEDGQKADLIDGVIYMASPDSLVGNDLCWFLTFLLRGYCEAKDLGKVVFSRFAFRLSEFNAPEPDVAYIAKERLHLLHATGMDGAPDIAVEIVSRESRQRDYFDKKQLYREAGVSEYWIIDPLQRRAEFYLLRDGRYQIVPLDQNRLFRSETLKGFWLDVEWLFTDTLPKALEKLSEILNT